MAVTASLHQMCRVLIRAIAHHSAACYSHGRFRRTAPNAMTPRPLTLHPPSSIQKEGSDILAAESCVERFDWSGRKAQSSDASVLLLHLAKMVRIARRYHLERARGDA